MEQTIFVKPKEGLTVLDPAGGRAVPAEGLRVPRTNYWLRRLNDGEVAVVQEAQQAMGAAYRKGKGEA